MQMKIVATSTYSTASPRVVEDTFSLKMRQSVCVDNLIAFDPADSFVYANRYGTSVVTNVSY